MTLFDLGQQKPHHYRDMQCIAWDSRDELAFTWRTLREGVGDGCALGTSGLHDGDNGRRTRLLERENPFDALL